MKTVQNWKQISQKYLNPQFQYAATVIHPLQKPQFCSYCQYEPNIIISISKFNKIKEQLSESKIHSSSSAQSQMEQDSHKHTQLNYIIKICHLIKQVIIRLFAYVLLISVIIQFHYDGIFKTHQYDLMLNKYGPLYNQLPQNIKHLVYEYVNNVDQFHAFVQTHAAITNITSCNDKEQCDMRYRSIMRSIDCLHFTHQNNYQKVYGNIQDLELNTIEKAEKYFEMLEYFNGQAFKLSSHNQAGSACLFQIKSTQTKNPQNVSSGGNSSTVINIQTIAYGPLHLFKNIQSLTSSLAAQNKFDVINFIIKKKETPKGFYKNALSIFKKEITDNQYSDFQLCKCLIICLQMFDAANYRRKHVKNQFFDSMYLSFKKTIIEDGVKNKSMYDMDKTKDFVVQQIQEGSKIILTAYSQSTILTNNLYQAMSTRQKQNIGLAYISPLVNNIPDQKGFYLYSSSDETNLKLSDFVKEKGYIENPLTPNRPKIQNCLDCEGDLHKIIQQIQSVIQNLTNITEQKIIKPLQYLGKGNITVQLKWDSQPDVDLHIWEPTGNHVYYSQRQGKCGFLDRDDTDGQGPEHYFTSSEKLISGTYVFKLNYYRGRSATKIFVTVSAGPQYFTKQLTLHPALGGIGNNDPPYHVCSIEATKNSKGYHSFKIIP